MVVVSCGRGMLGETLTWQRRVLVHVVVSMAGIVERRRFQVGITQASESATLPKLLLSGGCFFLARAEIVRYQCHVVNCCVLEMLRYLLVPRVRIISTPVGPPATHGTLRPL